MIQVICPTCHRVYTLSESNRGRLARCARCDTEFIVYDHGGWKLVIDFDDAPEDFEALVTIDYIREDDGSLAYTQEVNGVIEAGRDRLTLDSDWTGYDLAQLGFKPGVHLVVAYIDYVEIASGQLIVE